MFIYGWCDRMVLYPQVVNKLILLNTINLLYNHIKLQLEFQAEHNQKFHNMFFFSHHKLLPNRNHKVCKHPKLFKYLHTTSQYSLVWYLYELFDSNEDIAQLKQFILLWLQLRLMEAFCFFLNVWIKFLIPYILELNKCVFYHRKN